MFPPKMCENKKISVFGRKSPPKMEMPFMLYRFCGIYLFDKYDKFVIYLLSFRLDLSWLRFEKKPFFSVCLHPRYTSIIKNSPFLP